MSVRRGFSTYNDRCLQGDTEIWGFAPVGTAKDQMFTSMDTGLEQYFCLAMYSQYLEEAVSCMEHNTMIPACH